MGKSTTSNKGSMSLVTEPKYDPHDTTAWRAEQFGKLGFKGALKSFLADSRIDVGRVRTLVEKGASPLVAVRIEAGRDFAGDDRHFDHQRFDTLVAEEDANHPKG